MGTSKYTVDYSYLDNSDKFIGRLTKEIKTWDGSTTTETTIYDYDGNGNQLYKNVNGNQTNYVYDGFNQLIGYGTNVLYKYDGDGLRISKTIGTKTITHIWDGDQIALELVDGVASTKYIRGVNLIYQEDSANARKYYVYNGHGDVIQLTGTNGSGVLKTYDYDAFGVEKNPDTNDTNVYRYCGEYFDNETGTIYLRARYYNPGTGRFITEDSYRGEDNDPLSLNLYTYCHNNPVNAWDPSGHMSLDEAQYYYNTNHGMKMKKESTFDVQEKKASDYKLEVTKNRFIDLQGFIMMSWFLNGDGKKLDFSLFSNYLMANPNLQTAAKNEIMSASKNLANGSQTEIDSSIPCVLIIHQERLITRGDYTGYYLSNGADMFIGGLSIQGTIKKAKDGTIAYSINYGWNDTMDLHPEKYTQDAFWSRIGGILGANDYELKASWYSISVQGKNGKAVGWPFTNSAINPYK